MQRRIPRESRSLRGGSAACAAALALAACASTEAVPPETLSGFLHDYSILAPTDDGQPALAWVDPDARLGRYRRVMIDPVHIFYGVGTSLHDVPEEDLQTLADHLYASMVMTLQKDFPVVRRAAPDVLRVQLAITEAKGSAVVANTISAVLPIRPVSALTRLATGTRAFVGSAGIEAKLVDSKSERLLAAVVDRRAGAKNLDGVTDTWSDVLAAYDYWSAGLHDFLLEQRALEQGTEPTR